MDWQQRWSVAGGSLPPLPAPAPGCAPRAARHAWGLLSSTDPRQHHILVLPSHPAGVARLPLRRRGGGAAQPVRASFLGVGAPEAILVGVVALVVFGPKGLAQAAKSLGSTLRAFAPTIREITSVSQELKSSLEQVGLQ